MKIIFNFHNIFQNNLPVCFAHNNLKKTFQAHKKVSKKSFSEYANN